MTLTLRMLWREWRGGELRLLLLAVVVATAAVSSVAWLAERVAGATQTRAAQLLAADRSIERSSPIPAAWVEQARAAGLRTALTAEFPSVVLAGDHTRLVTVKAVEGGYPLRGELRLRDAAEAPEYPARGGPEPGRLWAEPRLLPLLGLAPGDALTLGEREFPIAALLSLEPDRRGFVASLAPRVMIAYQDLDSTGLLGPGSRARYRLLLAGPEAALGRFIERLQALQEEPLDVETPGGREDGVAAVVTKAERFLGLAAVLTVVVAGVAVLLSVRHYAERQLTAVALMRAIGAGRRRITLLFTGKLLWLGLIAGTLGSGLGFLLHALMLGLLAGVIAVELPPPGPGPLLTGWLTAFTTLLGFALPTLLRLRRSPPMRVLRRGAGDGLLAGAAPPLLALPVVLGLILWQAGAWQVASYVFAALTLTLALLALAAAAAVALLRRRLRHSGRLLWLGGVARRPWSAVLQIVAVGIGLMALFLLAVVRGDLLAAWQAEIPLEAPNQFLINVQPVEVEAIRTRLATAGIETRFYPMVRARITARNGEPFTAAALTTPRGRRLARREHNLSWAEQPRAEVVAGAWWQERPEEPEVSLEEGFAQELGLRLGDRLRFQAGSRSFEARVTSLRRVVWQSMQVNFFVVASPGALEGLPATWITSFHLPPERATLLNELVAAHPSVTPIDVSSILRTLREIIGQGSRVVELMALLTLAAGLLVLLAALRISGEERRFENALLRALGADGAGLRRRARWEFWLIGGLAGLIAGSAASLAGAVVATGLFDLDYPWNPAAILLGALAGMALVWLAGSLGARRYARVSPMRLLREGAE